MNRRKRDEASWLGLISSLWGPAWLAPGHGDDAAILPEARYAITTDFLAEGVDFETGWGPPQALGHKALAANLSDLSASGAKPAWFLLTLAIPESLNDDYVESLLEGMRDLSLQEGIRLAGGDLSRSRSGLCISITALGIQESRPLRRDEGGPGDLLFVSGPLGGPRAALSRFKKGTSLETFAPQAPPDGEQRLLDRFFRPPSQTGLGLFLSATISGGACMDVSDGLGRDLARLCGASGCGAEISAEALPLEKWDGGEATIDDAVSGGEEQVLLFSLPEEQRPLLSKFSSPLFEIGRLVKGREVILVRDGRKTAVSGVGFDHFSK